MNSKEDFREIEDNVEVGEEKNIRENFDLENGVRVLHSFSELVP